MELLVGLTLGLLLAMAAAPLWLSLERVGAGEGDRTVESLQGRVAVSRLERDLRLASGQGCLFALSAPVVEASTSQVVFLRRADSGSAPILVEWEVNGGALMRRWGSCPDARPATYKHSLFRDSKTMLEGVKGRGSFAYVVDGAVVAGPLSESDLPSIEAVVVGLEIGGEDGGGSARVTTTARVGR